MAVAVAEVTRTLVVSCADWPVVALGVDLSRPVAVMASQRVMSLNDAARESGLSVGLRRREAQRRNPQVTLHDRDPDREARTFDPVVGALEEVAARTQIVRPGVLSIPVRGPSRYFGGDEPLAVEVAAVVARSVPSGVRVGVGVADGLFAASLAARRSAAVVGPDVSVVPLVVDEGASGGFVADAPISALGRPELTSVLARLGLTEVGVFAALDTGDVVARFGREGSDAHRLARGLDLVPPSLSEPPPDLEVAHEADPALERVDHAAFVAKSLADDFHARLGSRGIAATAILISAVTVEGEVVERRWRHEGALGAAAVAQRLRWQLDGWLTSTGGRRSAGAGAIRTLSVRPEAVMAAVGRQQGFWGGTTEAGERAMQGLARVQSLLGEDAVRRAEWKGARSPGEQYRMVPLDAEPSSGTSELGVPVSGAGPGEGESPWPGRLPDPPPALVWVTPRRISVVDSSGEQVRVSGRGAVSAPPAKVAMGSQQWRAVIAWSGPWLCDERWWDALGHRRRARFQVVLDDRSAHLLAVESQLWWWEAAYD